MTRHPQGRRARRLLLAGLTLAAVLAFPALPRASASASASAGAGGGVTTITSDNWAGYAAHGHGVKFQRAAATWREPAAICTTGEESYSAFWIGIGGYSRSSEALEQIGTELDCTASGRATMSAWYELLPAPTRAVRMAVRAGDLMTAGVSIRGRRVTLRIADETRRETFARTIVDHSIDATSAEWIAEAPSDCSKSGACTTLPLTDFDGVDFSGATATTTTGTTSGIDDPAWTTTKLLLGYRRSGTAFVAKATSARATPTGLTDGGRVFRVDFSAATSTSSSGSGTSGSGGGSSTGGSGTGGSGTGGSGTGGSGGGPGPGGGPGGGGGPPGPSGLLRT